MTIAACAALVERGDPVRFLAAMAAPVAARRVLFPLYAFALEVARAPYVTQEPLIAEMRLQFWRDVADGIGARTPPQAHEVARPLADVMPAAAAPVLDGIAAARLWDVRRAAFADAAAFDTYLEQTAGGVMAAAALALEAAGDGVRDVGYAAGLARFLVAVPQIEATGRIPLLDGRAQAVAELARGGLMRLAQGLAAVSGAARPAILEAVEAGPILRQAAADPARVADGTLGLAPARLRWRLLTGRLG